MRTVFLIRALLLGLVLGCSCMVPGGGDGDGVPDHTLEWALAIAKAVDEVQGCFVWMFFGAPLDDNGVLNDAGGGFGIWFGKDGDDVYMVYVTYDGEAEVLPDEQSYTVSEMPDYGNEDMADWIGAAVDACGGDHDQVFVGLFPDSQDQYPGTEYCVKVYLILGGKQQAAVYLAADTLDILDIEYY